MSGKQDKLIYDSIMNLEGLIRKTKEAVVSGSKEILEIVIDTRTKIHKLKDELIEVRARLANIIVIVDNAESELDRTRSLMYTYKKMYDRDSIEIKKLYEEIATLATTIDDARKAEYALNTRRNTIEIYLRENGELLERSEKVLNQVMLAIDYLDIGDSPMDSRNPVLRIIEAQDSEKHRLSRDIHDGPAQSLVSIILKAELAEKLIGSSPNRLRKELKQIQIGVRETLSDIRQIIFDLMPYTMEEHGLTKTLKDLVKSTRKIDIKLIINEEAPVASKVIETNVFRIIQELYSNVVKHSRAKSARIILEIKEDFFQIRVLDNGVGFFPHADNNGYGLKSVADRVELLDGSLSLESKKGETLVFIKLPNNPDSINRGKNEDIHN